MNISLLDKDGKNTIIQPGDIVTIKTDMENDKLLYIEFTRGLHNLTLVDKNSDPSEVFTIFALQIGIVGIMSILTGLEVSPIREAGNRTSYMFL